MDDIMDWCGMKVHQLMVELAQIRIADCVACVGHQWTHHHHHHHHHEVYLFQTKVHSYNYN